MCMHAHTWSESTFFPFSWYEELKVSIMIAMMCSLRYSHATCKLIFRLWRGSEHFVFQSAEMHLLKDGVIVN